MVNKLTSEKKLTAKRQIGTTRQLTCKSPAFLKFIRSNRQTKQKQLAEDSGTLQERFQELQAYNNTLRKRVVDLQAQIHKLSNAKAVNPLDASLHEELQNLKDENATLRSQIAKLKEEVQSASKSVNIAWQQGYLAGQLAAQEAAQQEQEHKKGFIETLAEAAQAATEYGGAESTPAVATATATKTEEPAPAHEQPYVVESPAYLAEALQDPEVLNDPFTAKLLGALGGDIPDEEEEEAPEPEVKPEPPKEATMDTPQPAYQSRKGDAADSVPDFDETPSAFESDYQSPEEPAFAKPVSSAADTGFAAEPDGLVDETQLVSSYMKGNAESLASQTETQVDLRAQESLLNADGDGTAETKKHELPPGAEETGNFDADELHNLFRNKYVRPDEPEKAIDPGVSGTFPSFKKFVGTNKQQAEPLPTASRVFPPEIRKACKLLGVNPEEITKPIVLDSWKKEMAKPGVHPDTGGDTEMAIYLNTAKDTLIRWLEDQTPKLGKKFGAGAQGTREQTKPQQNKKE